MKPDVVVDVGNSRIKWGLCRSGQVIEHVALGPDEEDHWQVQYTRWNLTDSSTWVVAGVHPQRCARFLAWLSGKSICSAYVHSWESVPVRVAVETPYSVGIDRLLNALAANSRRPPGQPVVAVDAGSAVTVDSIDASGTFRGGAIFPGLRLMGHALHANTALLPEVKVLQALPALPGTSTAKAIEAGIYYAVAGAIKELTERLSNQQPGAATVFLTGGDAAILRPAIRGKLDVWPEMTLEGIRLAAEGLS